MTVQEFRPGDTLEMITGHRNIKGVLIEQSQYITYEDLQKILNSAEDRSSKEPVREYRTTVGASFNRNVALFARAIKTGEWSNGRVIFREKIAQSFLKKAEAIDTEEFKNIKKSVFVDLFDTVVKHQVCFSAETFERLTDVLESMELEVK